MSDPLRAIERSQAVMDKYISEVKQWPEPVPLIQKTESIEYPINALPPIILNAVNEVTGFVQSPVSMAASSALAALSLAAQSHIDAKRAEMLESPTGLFFLTIADSGERKSTCDSFFTKAIKNYEAEQDEKSKPLINQYRADIEAWESKRSGIKDAIRQLAKSGKPAEDMELNLSNLEREKPELPRVPRLLYNDATPEALSYGLAKQWPSGGVMSAEAGIVFGSHGMGKDSLMRNLGLLNQLWDGASVTFDRRTSESFTVRGARLTVALQVQEPTLREFFNKSGMLLRGTGFLARFLVACPESTQGQRFYTEAPDNWPALASFNKRLTEILDLPEPLDKEGALSPLMLSLTPKAKEVWIAFHDGIEGELVSSGELYDVRDVASKSADNCVRLAALFEFFENSNAKQISEVSVRRAIQIVSWHLNESKRFFGELALPLDQINATHLDRWLIDHCKNKNTNRCTKRHIQQYGPSPLRRDKNKLMDSLSTLCDLNRIKILNEGKSIMVNPQLTGIEE